MVHVADTAVSIDEAEAMVAGGEVEGCEAFHGEDVSCAPGASREEGRKERILAADSKTSSRIGLAVAAGGATEEGRTPPVATAQIIAHARARAQGRKFRPNARSGRLMRRGRLC